MPYALDEAQTLIAAISTIFLGRAVNGWVSFLRKANIPPAITGGFLVCIVMALLWWALGWQVTLGTEAKGVLLLAFFSAIGLSARLNHLVRGGWRLAAFCAAILLLMICQNLAGMSLAKLFGQPAAMGLFTGSISFIGGHGTVGAWAQTESGRALEGALGVGMTCATFGLIMGGLVGGPVATLLMKLAKPDAASVLPPEVAAKDGEPHIEEQPTDRYLVAILALTACVVLGSVVSHFLQKQWDLTLPSFLCAMLSGVLLTSAADATGNPLDRGTIDTCGTICLRIFLAMSLMGLRLWELAGQAGFILSAVVLQIFVIVSIACLVVFPLGGRSREGAALAGATIGFGLGATPVAMGTLKRLEQRFGQAPLAMLMVTLAVSFFIDYANAGVIQGFLMMLK